MLNYEGSCQMFLVSFCELKLLESLNREKILRMGSCGKRIYLVRRLHILCFCNSG